MAVCPNGHDSASDDFCDVCGMRIDGTPVSPAAGSSPAASAPSPQPGPDHLAGADPCPRCGTPRTGQFCEACGFNFSGPRFIPASPSTGSPSTGSYSTAQPPPPAPSFPPPPAAFPVPSASPAPSAESAPSAPSVPSAPNSSSMSSFPYPQATWTVVVGADRAYYEQVQALAGPEGTAVTFPSYCAERRFQLVGSQMRIGRRSVSRGLSPEIDLTGPPADPGISRLHAVLVATPDGSWAVLDPGSVNGTLVNGSEIGIGDQVPLQDGDRINLGAWTSITVHRG
jgi:pSer/pThr/pTyr-binding forkhead associated (FHA) protein